jgi:lysophospholipid hydrolase
MLWHILNDFLSPVAHMLDWGIDWVHLKSGEMLVHKGRCCNSIYIVLAGRLRADFHESDRSDFDRVKYKEFGKGACLGDIELLTGTSWPGDYYALRNSELALIPDSVLNFIFARFPESGFHLAKLIAKQAQSLQSEQQSSEERSSDIASRTKLATNIATIAVVPHSMHSHGVGSFCDILRRTLDEIAPTALVSKDLLAPITDSDQYHQHWKITQLLGELEETYRFLVFHADSVFDWWTKQCIKQADCVLLLIDSDMHPNACDLDDYLDNFHKTLNKRIELVIFCKQHDREQPIFVCDEINAWSEKRAWPIRHHIVRLPFDKFMIDLQRLCRRLSGLSVGLVLGGGGARGLAHVGVIKAIIEAGITVDIVGGCSQGALIGSIYSMHPDPCDFNLFLITCRRMARMMSSIADKLFDLTFPVVSYFNGSRFNRTVSDILGTNTRIQNLLLNFFCVSVDVCHNIQRVHDRGLCWKYVRASMSLHSYLPPISENNCLLLDGGYVNILPVDVMSNNMGATTIIAVDVSGEDSNEYFEYGAQLSGWWLLWNSWNPFLKTVKVPSMGELSQKLIWVSSNRHLKKVSKDAHLLLVPPVHSYGTLDYDKFDEIVQIGYDHSISILHTFVEQNPWVVS